MRKIKLTLRPTESFAIRSANGYQVYGALLNAVSEHDSDTSKQIHNSDIGSLHNSGIRGSFQDSDRRFHDQVDQTEKYKLALGVTDPADQAVFEALAGAFVFDGDMLELSEGALRVHEFSSSSLSHRELLAQAADSVSELPNTFEIKIRFQTPTCISGTSEITTAFPHSGAVFRSLLGKWNATVPSEFSDELEFGMTRQDFESSLIEKPDTDTHNRHSILVNRDENGAPVLAQGFTATCSYKFKTASEAVRNAVTTLARFGEYSGVGSSVSRGCGCITTEVSP